MKWVKDLIPATSNFGRGTEAKVFPFTWTRDGQTHEAKLAPMICYEDIFPSFGRRVAKLGPNLLVNITNDAWFGNTSEPWEHMALSVYRAVELRLDLVRAVNTGVSTVIDAAGRVRKKTIAVDPDEGPVPAPPMTLLEDVAILAPATLYATLGEWFGGLCLAIVLVLGLRARKLAGGPLRAVIVVQGALVAFGVLAVGLLLIGGPSGIGLGLRLVAHMAVPGVDEALAFSTGVWLIAFTAVASLVAGAFVRRRGGERQEIVSALLVVLVAPAIFFGTLEGEQAGLVISALVAIALAILGGRLARRRAA